VYRESMRGMRMNPAYICSVAAYRVKTMSKGKKAIKSHSKRCAV
jgi:hypothetical protein